MAGFTDSFGQGIGDAWVLNTDITGLFYDNPPQLCVIQRDWTPGQKTVRWMPTKQFLYDRPLVPPVPTDASPVDSTAVSETQCGAQGPRPI